MHDISVGIILLLITLIVNFILIKYSIFIDDKNLLPHKTFIENNKSVPYSGGIILSICLFFFIPTFDYSQKIFFLSIFFLGLFSDKGILNSAIKRFILQLLIISSFLYFSEILITSLNVGFLDKLLSIKYVSYVFTIFCLLVLINGTNFLDGVNTLVIGYYLLVISIVLLLINSLNINFDLVALKVIAICLAVIFIFNFFGKLYFGDNGSYLVALVVGFLLIKFANNNSTLISPYFIALLLWYPAFENLFSIIRKKLKKIPASKPDNSHLHHLLFIFLNKRIARKNISNTITGVVINFYNLVIFMIGSKYYFYTKILLFLLLINVIVYVSVYFNLKKKT